MKFNVSFRFVLEGRQVKEKNEQNLVVKNKLARCPSLTLFDCSLIKGADGSDVLPGLLG